MPTYSNDPAGRPVAPPAYPPAYPPPGRLPGGPIQPDNRPLLIAALVALVALVAVVGYYLLVYVPARDARLAEAPAAAPAVGPERPPGSLADDGDGFRPSVIEEAPPVRVDDDGTRATDDARTRDAEREADGVDGADGLEAPPRRTPVPAQAPDPRPAPSPAPAPVARAEHEAFARDYLARQTDDAASNVVGLYATTVRYYNLGRVDAQTVSVDKEAYYRRFPDRRYALAGPVRVLSSTGSGAATVRFDYTFAVGGGPGGERSGRAYVELDIVPSGDTYLIRGERGDVY